jgi:hypothetical protein
MNRRSFGLASAWLAAFVFGVPSLGLAVMMSVLGARSGVSFAVWYPLLMVLSYPLGLIVLLTLRLPSNLLRALVAAMVVYAITLAIPLTRVMASYPLQVVRCGALPVIANNFAAARSYSVPGDESYTASPLHEGYFCSVREAEAARYHRARF